MFKVGDNEPSPNEMLNRNRQIMMGRVLRIWGTGIAQRGGVFKIADEVSSIAKCQMRGRVEDI